MFIILDTLHVESSQQSSISNIRITLILQKGKLRHKKVKSFAQSHGQPASQAAEAIYEEIRPADQKGGQHLPKINFLKKGKACYLEMWRTVPEEIVKS